jgi:hypothetical protein
MLCNCGGRIHAFTCFLRNIATNANRRAQSAGRELNAR